MFYFLGPALLIIVATLFGWISLRARKAKSAVVKWGGTGLAASLSVVVACLALITVNGLFKLHARSAPAPLTNVAGTPKQIQRGKAISDGFCSACHSKSASLTGGLDIGEHFPVPVGSFISSNLTPVGRLNSWTDADIFRAIRNSVDPDGRWLIIMSYTNAGKLSDDDIRAIIAYIRNVPAAGKATEDPPDRLNLLGIVMLGAGMLPEGKPVYVGPITAPSVGPTLQYGEYILSYQDCRACHGANLTGGGPGQLSPIAPDLNLVKGWKLEEFVATMRTGVDPNGHEISKEMPWQPIGRMSDEELRAIYEYLTHLPDA